MAKFKRKPEIVEAWQFTRDNLKDGSLDEIKDADNVRLWFDMGGIIRGELKIPRRGYSDKYPQIIREIKPYDWIIKTFVGWEICTPTEFKDAYEEI